MLSVSVLYMQALDKAKESSRKERLLCKQREQASLADQINLDLTYCVCQFLELLNHTIFIGILYLSFTAVFHTTGVVQSC